MRTYRGTLAFSENRVFSGSQKTHETPMEFNDFMFFLMIFARRFCQTFFVFVTRLQRKCQFTKLQTSDEQS